MSMGTERPEVSFEREVVSWCDAVYTEAENTLQSSHEYKLTSKIIDYIHGRQWSARSRYGRSRPVKNRVFRQFIETVGLLTDIQPDFQVTIHDRVQGYSELQDLLNKIIGQWATASDFEMELAQVVMFGLIHSGFNKLSWDSSLNGGLGDNSFQPISPVNLMMVGASSKLQDSECVIYRKPVTMAALIRKYGNVAKSVRPDSQYSELPGMSVRPNSMSKGSWANLSPALRKLLGTKQDVVQSKYPQVMLREFWLRDDAVWEGSESILVGRKGTNWSYMVEPGQPIYPRGRVVVQAGNKILEDTCNPYWHGMFPFSQYRPYRVPWQLEGASMMEPIVAMQNIVNRINGGVMDVINATIEPSIMGPKGALSQQGWDSLDPGAPGAKIAYNNNTPKPLEYRRPPELGSYVLPFEQSIEQEQDMTSGAAVMNQLAQKKQVPGGDSLDQIMNSRSTNIRFAGRSLQSYITEVGQQSTGNILQFANSRYRIAKFGADGIVASDFEPLYGNMIPRGIKPESFVRNVSFGIRKGSLLAIEKQDKVTVAFALRKMGDLSRRRLFAILDENLDQKLNEQELKEEAAEKIALAAAAGAMGHGKPGKK